MKRYCKEKVKACIGCTDEEFNSLVTSTVSKMQKSRITSFCDPNCFGETCLSGQAAFNVIMASGNTSLKEKIAAYASIGVTPQSNPLQRDYDPFEAAINTYCKCDSSLEV